jgi:Phage tail tube protein FII
MSDPIRVGHITQADVYIDGNRFIGRVKEFEIPEFGHKMVSHEALGMIGILELPSRAVEALKGKIVFDYVDYEADQLILNPTKVLYWQLHAFVDVFDAAGVNTGKSHKRILTVGVMFSKSNALSLKLGENAERELEVSVVSLIDKVSTVAIPLLEYDAFNRIYNINGVPVWPD